MAFRPPYVEVGALRGVRPPRRRRPVPVRRAPPRPPVRARVIAVPAEDRLVLGGVAAGVLACCIFPAVPAASLLLCLGGLVALGRVA